MPCYKPLDGYRARSGGLTFSKRDGYVDQQVKIACGRCIGCRIDRSKAWAIRCLHEASLHEENSFLTLTYDSARSADVGSLDKSHFQKFMKRLRASISPKRIRFFHCGEYGEQLYRPHYHALIFGHDFADKRPHKKSHDGSQLYVSTELERLWGLGFCMIGAVTFESAAYCARYIMKKITGDQAVGWYQQVDPETGQCFPLLPEYITMSNRPGIGHGWFQQFQGDVFPDDFVIAQGKKMKTPRYYDKLLKRRDQELLVDLKKKRVKRSINRRTLANNKPARLAVREEVATARANLTKRNLS